MGSIGAGLTRGGFRRAMEEARSAAADHVARPQESEAERVRRLASVVVLPERFNREYLQHYFRDESPAFHQLLYWALETEMRLAVRVPRGHAKSTVVTLAYVLHQVVCAPILQAWEEGRLDAEQPALAAAMREVMAEEVARRVAAGMPSLDSLGLPAHWDPAVDRELQVWLGRWYLRQLTSGGKIQLHWDPFIQIIGETEELAIEFGDAIRVELQRNAALRADWGDLSPVRALDWGMESPGASSQDVWESNGTRVALYGIREGIRGGRHGARRPTLAIFDDCDGEESVKTKAQRDSNEDKLDRAVEGGLDPKRGRVFLAGTPHHPDCVVVRKTDVAESRVGWTSLRFRARDEQGRILFPGLFPADILAEKFARLREKAEPELGDRPPRLGNRPFQRVHHYEFDAWKDVRLPKVLMADPSYGRSQKSDYQAGIVLRGPTPELRPRILVHRAVFWRIPDPEEYTDNLNLFYAEEEPDLAAIEAIALGHIIQMLAVARGRREGLFPGWLRVERHEESKDLRVVGTSPLINDGTVVTPSDGRCRELELQWLNWGESGSKRDGPDVFEMALRLLRRFSGTGGAPAGPDARHGQRRFGHEAGRRSRR